MNIDRLTFIKYLIVYGIFFLALSILFSIFQNLSPLLANSLNKNIILAGGVIISIILGLFFFNYLIKRFDAKKWDILIMIFPIIIGLGGLGYLFTPMSAVLIGFASPGLIFMILPANIASWSHRFFGPTTHAGSIVGVAFGSAVGVFSFLHLFNQITPAIPIFSIFLIILGILCILPIIRNKIEFFESESIIKPTLSEKDETFLPKYIINFVTILGWNFIFLLITEFWYRMLETDNAENISSQNDLVSLIIALCIGLGLMIFIQFLFRMNIKRLYLTSLIACVSFFIFTILFFFSSPYNADTGNIIFIILSLLFLPLFAAGIFNCIPYDFENSLFNLIQFVFIFIDIGILLISDIVYPNLLQLVGLNSIFPTVYLLNIIFLGMMFIFQLLRFSVKTKADFTSL